MLQAIFFNERAIYRGGDKEALRLLERQAKPGASCRLEVPVLVIARSPCSGGPLWEGNRTWEADR
jgi:hypothetical protein